MSDNTVNNPSDFRSNQPNGDNMINEQKHLKKRHGAEKRFRLYGVLSLLVALLFLVSFFFSIFNSAAPAFTQTEVKLSIFFDPEIVDISQVLANDKAALNQTLNMVDYNALIHRALEQLLPSDMLAKENIFTLTRQLLSTSAQDDLMAMVKADTAIIGQTHEVWLAASGGLDSTFQGYVDTKADEGDRPVSDNVLRVAEILDDKGLLRETFNQSMFSKGDSRSPQDAGIKGALLGSFFTLLVTLALSFPIAVMAAVYLEEFAPQNKFTDFLEANINNLAAVPSIIFGLLGLAVFISFFGLPRSTPLVGGLVLTLMTLPTIIISSRAALKSVPPSIRSAALGLGASKMQVIFHHVLPLALPGMLTGTIIGMAQALGETAPLLMIGMVAFIADSPSSIVDPAAVMPVQIYLWSDLPERAFEARASFAIIILLAFLVAMNALAVLLRKKFERKW